MTTIEQTYIVTVTGLDEKGIEHQQNVEVQAHGKYEAIDYASRIVDKELYFTYFIPQLKSQYIDIPHIH